MTIVNLDNPSMTFHFKNLSRYTTTWKMVDGKLVGVLVNIHGVKSFEVAFPISK